MLVARFGVKSGVFVSPSDDIFLNNKERNQFVFSMKILFGFFFPELEKEIRMNRFSGAGT